MLKKYYGEVILKKDIVLYHTTDELFNYREDKHSCFVHFSHLSWME